MDVQRKYLQQIFFYKNKIKLFHKNENRLPILQIAIKKPEGRQ